MANVKQLTHPLLLLIAATLVACSPGLVSQAGRGMVVPVGLEQTEVVPGPVVWAPGGHVILSAANEEDEQRLVLHDGSRLMEWDGDASAMTRFGPVLDRWISGPKISPDGRYVLVREGTTYPDDRPAFQGLAVVAREDGRIVRRITLSLPRSGGGLLQTDFSSDSQRVLAVLVDREEQEAWLVAWSLATGENVARYPLDLVQLGIEGRDQALFFGHGDRLLLYRSRAYGHPIRVRVMDTTSGAILSDWEKPSPCDRLASEPPIMCVQKLAVDQESGQLLLAVGAGMPGGEGSHAILQSRSLTAGTPAWETTTSDHRIPSGFEQAADGTWQFLDWEPAGDLVATYATAFEDGVLGESRVLDKRCRRPRSKGFDACLGGALYPLTTSGGGSSDASVGLAGDVAWLEAAGKPPVRAVLPGQKDDWQLAGLVESGPSPLLFEWNRSGVKRFSLEPPDKQPDDGWIGTLLFANRPRVWVADGQVLDARLLDSRVVALVHSGQQAGVEILDPETMASVASVVLPDSPELTQAVILRSPTTTGFSVLATNATGLHRWQVGLETGDVIAHKQWDGYQDWYLEGNPQGPAAAIHSGAQVRVVGDTGEPGPAWQAPAERRVQRALALADGGVAAELVGWGHTWVWQMLVPNRGELVPVGALRTVDTRAARAWQDGGGLDILEASGAVVSVAVSAAGLTRTAGTYLQRDGATWLRLKAGAKPLFPESDEWRESARRALKHGFLVWGHLTSDGRLER